MCAYSGTRRLLNFPHFQPHIFSKFLCINKTKKKIHYSNIIPGMYILGRGAGERFFEAGRLLKLGSHKRRRRKHEIPHKPYRVWQNRGERKGLYSSFPSPFYRFYMGIRASVSVSASISAAGVNQALLFGLQGERLFEVGAYSQLGADTNKYGLSVFVPRKIILFTL